ncbi:UDP-N-Acetylglucosamine 2-epimerase [Desulfonispora thiosulfatigenes DSM 11270]|uniref:UDP-N-acetylglucosamine 2-epimerase (non-hydrolyzing) n=1 Tax=Desulfonispora thiosulfatigenes DSM 11270 TaxID=656914 RepID=A0A1W1V6Z8_DESTI|nr:UDP-N-acetylglucosamine 2-epimerase (non-hydrolyzing) [Desulfonispora thiosulfatigenes]SMB89122.1 UDP-N-Acetylglucosamine 2-epimerase [Desulfonispora thiosulfatigenes DSM 11270]
MLKILSIFGTRPEAIKMAPLVKELEKSEYIDSKVCVTAQHRQMLDQVLKTFKIVPDYDLNIMKDRQTLTGVTNKVLSGIEEIFEQDKFDMVLVHGDTTTTFASSLAAFYSQIKVGHVEAGLRTYNKYSPYPEEMNRQMTGILADLHFSPTGVARDNLVQENKPESAIYITGNTVIDALTTTVDEGYHHEVLEKISKDKRIVLVTAHRRENLGEPLENICKAILRLVEEFPDIEVIYPVHLNPRVREVTDKYLSTQERIHLIEPLDVLDFHNFMNRAYLILTDSGGLQEEAPSLGKPVLVLRDTTERPEGVSAGTLKLVGTDEELIYSEAKELLTNEESYLKMAQTANPYGDGKASKRIVEAILHYFGKGEKPEEFRLN